MQNVKEIRWSLVKNEKLEKTRGASFEDLINSKQIKIMKNPKRDNQNIMLFEYKNYIWIVPFVEENDYYFLKTLFPSRKYTKIFKEGMI